MNSQIKFIQMKKLTLCVMAVFLSLTFMPTQLKAATGTSTLTMVETKTVESAKASVLTARLDEIKAMDKTTLNSSEKQQLRKEVRSIKGQLSDMGGGVYLSVGAILLIALLLIILL
jgi:hypothetical protein